jgi:prepilin-type N-terminal cleavage/methylation domain-containing protein
MKNLKVSNKKGFSLVELLVVIAVIGVIAAIAIPAMSGIFGKADNNKTLRNAQNIVSSFNAARAAGNTTVYADEDAAVAAIVTATGITGAGSFSATRFSAPMQTSEAAAAKAHIDISGTGADLTLVYTPPLTQN